MTKNKIISTVFRKYFFLVMLLACIFLLVIFPTLSMTTFLEGIMIWATKVLPALLPFFILTKLLSYTQFITKFGAKISPLTRKLYGVGGVSGYVYLMSVVSGYPVGAKLTSDLYSARIITRRQAISITSFTSTSGPLFVLGTLGIGMFGSSRVGIIVLISHYIGALLNGFLYKNHQTTDTRTLSTSVPENFLNESMTSSITSIMTVGGFIALFYMLVNILISVNAFFLPIKVLEIIGVNGDFTTAIIASLFEITSGAILLSTLSLSQNFAIVLLSFLISLGGISIHAQAYCFLKNFDMSYPYFLLQKTSHALLATMVALGVILIF
jgi:sporulation integral membrane protein YlbJ